MGISSVQDTSGKCGRPRQLDASICIPSACASYRNEIFMMTHELPLGGLGGGNHVFDFRCFCGLPKLNGFGSYRSNSLAGGDLKCKFFPGQKCGFSPAAATNKIASKEGVSRLREEGVKLRDI